MWPAENTLDKIEYFDYNNVGSQYFRYKHPWTHILYSKLWFPICHDHMFTIATIYIYIDLYSDKLYNCS